MEPLVDEHQLSRMVTLEVTMKNLEDDLKCLNKKLIEIDSKMDDLSIRLSSWKGGVLALVGLASVVGISFASVVVFLRGL